MRNSPVFPSNGPRTITLIGRLIKPIGEPGLRYIHGEKQSKAKERRLRFHLLHRSPLLRNPLRSSEEEATESRSPPSTMDDPELEAIRQRRMQELMGQRGAANPQNAGQQKAQEDAKQEAEERRQMMLAQILSSEARERLSRIALVKPDKARGVEDVILRAAQTGGISEKVSEERLISLLEQINTHTTKQTKVTIQRRRNVLDDDD
ncbi:DNA-binding protein DDB_G0278111 isoform X2 [Brachypodium distachyon]|nr:DNA-binding protein DDB_G0278111 isoform X2 [Brachypodium distachyon]|eukprot:XP_003567965.2 DNA-binding protein DDB_G0278111 isoform X2 [Brachypodium distachyon]